MIMNWIKVETQDIFFQINVGNRRIRHRTTLDFDLKSILVDLEIRLQFQSRCMSDPTLSDINFKNDLSRMYP